MIEVDIAHAAFNQPAGQQAVQGERAEGGRSATAAAEAFELAAVAVDAVQFQRRFRLARQIDQFGGRRLHPEGEFVSTYPTGNFAVADARVALLVQLAESVESLPLELR